MKGERKRELNDEYMDDGVKKSGYRGEKIVKYKDIVKKIEK